jgi:hypothetical protein
LLFKAVGDAILSWCKEQGFLPGFVSIMHTFGSILDFHPHIHVLWAEGGCHRVFQNWRQCNYFPHQALKERFKYYLIKYLRAWAKENRNTVLITPDIVELWRRKLKCDTLFRVTQSLYEIIWYVHIGEKLDNAVFTVHYIGRYAKRPAIAETRIIDYDRESKMVTFAYRDKTTGADETTAIAAEEFIGRLVRHIPEKHFKMIRYYGFYANRVKNRYLELLAPYVIALFGLAALTFSPDYRAGSWRERIRMSAGNDPLICPDCHKQMELTAITYRSRDGPLKTVYITA